MKSRLPNISKNLILTLGIITYILSLVLNAAGGHNGLELLILGFLYFTMGLIGILTGGEFVIFFETMSWLGNPCVIFSFIILFFQKKIKLSAILAGIAFVLQIEFLLIRKLPIGVDHKSIPVEIETGYYFWILTSIILLIGNLILLNHKYHNSKSLSR